MRPIARGELWQRVREQSARALRTGELEPWATEVDEVRDGEALFRVRTLTRRSKYVPPAGDPFAWPWAGELFVGDLSATHGVLLNKYPVFDHHALIVTRAFEPQTDALTAGDGDALRWCLDEGGDVLGFFNGGAGAGASQAHKHLQLAPLVASLEPMIRAGKLPVRHALAPTPPDGAALAATVARLLRELGVGPQAPWNLLATRDWLLVVPRRAEAFEGMSVNALGFAGSLLVKSKDQLERLRALGPLEVLRAVGWP